MNTKQRMITTLPQVSGLAEKDLEGSAVVKVPDILQSTLPPHLPVPPFRFWSGHAATTELSPRNAIIDHCS